MQLILGAVADDFTGATDLASMLARGGLSTILQLGRPRHGDPCPAAQAVVVALKSRTSPVDAAVSDSVASWRWVAEAGAGVCYFKYCSTFDSTPQGNIGPVAEALMSETGASQTIYTPAFPENGRTIYQGKLFVGHELLSESGMRNHPLTPMTDSDLTKVLTPQLSAGAKVGLVRWEIVRQGAAAIKAELGRLGSDGIAHVVVDGLTQEDLDALAEGTQGMPLVTAGSGLGLSMAKILAGADAEPSDRFPEIGGPALMLSGSCSQASNAQVDRWEADGGAIIRLDPREIAADSDGVRQRVAKAALDKLNSSEAVLISATQPPDMVQAVQAELGSAKAAEFVEVTLAAIAVEAKHAGVRRFIVAGGETSGAVAQALGATRLAVGPSIAPGVPWCATLDDKPLALALKSGNFGRERFFADALGIAP